MHNHIFYYVQHRFDALPKPMKLAAAVEVMLREFVFLILSNFIKQIMRLRERR